MSPVGQEVVQITPLSDCLVINHSKNHGVYTCSEDSCSFSTSSPSLLGLHKAQAHNIKTGPKKGVVHHYFCPEEGCYYNPQSGRFFKTLDTLRTHYMKVHVEKKFKCSKCEKAFGLERDCLRHEKECGQSFTCPDCGKIYNSKGALNMHCQSKGHKKPVELCTKTKASAVTTVVDKAQMNKSHPVPILPKLSSQDKTTLILPLTATHQSISTGITNQNIPFCMPPLINVVLDNDNGLPLQLGKMTQPHPSPVSTIGTTVKNLYCDNVAQTIKSMSSQTKIKCHTPTQTGLSILEKAMKSSKIPVNRTSKGTQKSLATQSSYKKRKNNEKFNGVPTKRYKRNSKLTAATLKDPFLCKFSQNTGSQTLFSFSENQHKSMAVNTLETFGKMSMSTQTIVENPLYLNQTGEMSDLNFQDFTFPLHTSNHPMMSQYNATDYNKVSGSATNTLSSFFTQRNLNNSETQTYVTHSSTSTTQTQEKLALNSSTQTLRLETDLDDGSSFLDDFFSENEGINVNTQTFGCFSSDMMTQTLEQLVCDASLEADNVTNTLDTGNSFITNNMTTQTFEEMVDNITQTFDSKIMDCTTQTDLRTDIMTQTFNNIGVDIMTQTFDMTTLDNGNFMQPLRSQHFENLYHPNSPLQKNETTMQTSFKNYNIVTQPSSSQPDEIFSKDVDKISEFLDLITDTPNSETLTRENKKSRVGDVPSSETKSIDVLSQESYKVLFENQTQAREMLYGKSCDTSPKQNVANPVTDSMTQTLSLPDEDLALEALLSDMATQTFEEDDLTFDALLEASNNLSPNFVPQPPHGLTLTNTACQTPVPVCSKTTREISNSNDTTVNGCDYDYTEGGNLWEMGTQTSVDNVKEIALQTNNEDLWEIACQTEMSLSGSNNNQTVVDDSLEMGTQTSVGVNECSVTGMQIHAWEMGMQSGGDNMWEMGTQTGGDNLWEMGTQTGGDNLWEMGTQTGGDNLWEMGTQTGGDNLWEMGTQTGGDNLWEMGTQTGGDNLWEMGTQAGGDHLWEMGTQTGVDHLWEMGTQTGGDNLWEMGTQTMDSLLTDTMTQTGDDLIDFLLTADTRMT